MRWLDQNSGAVARIGFATASASVIEVKQDLQGLLNNRMGFATLNVDDEANAAGFVFELRIVQALLRRRARELHWSAVSDFCFSAHAEEITVSNPN